MQAVPGLRRLALSVALGCAALAGPHQLAASQGATETGPDEHLDCAAIYMLYGLGIPSQSERADARVTLARQLYLDAIAASVPRVLSEAAIDTDLRERLHRRALPLLEARTQADQVVETDALIEDTHACDARYDLVPMPIPAWSD